jgi:hypothetical protein
LARMMPDTEQSRTTTIAVELRIMISQVEKRKM